MCIERQKATPGHYVCEGCEGIDAFLYGLYEKGFITNVFLDDGVWKWRVLDVWAVKYLVTFYERIKYERIKIVVE
jgi:hypothetical protein